MQRFELEDSRLFGLAELLFCNCPRISFDSLGIFKQIFHVNQHIATSLAGPAREASFISPG
jgi:hypothetical protein